VPSLRVEEGGGGVGTLWAYLFLADKPFNLLAERQCVDFRTMQRIPTVFVNREFINVRQLLGNSAYQHVL
jgi:hypothetical protein